MAPGMVADHMTGGDDTANYRGIRLGAATEHKEGRPHIVFGQNLKQSRGKGWIGPVVEGQGEFVGVAITRGRDQRGAEDLRLGPHCGIGKAARR